MARLQHHRKIRARIRLAYVVGRSGERVCEVCPQPGGVDEDVVGGVWGVEVCYVEDWYAFPVHTTQEGFEIEEGPEGDVAVCERQHGARVRVHDAVDGGVALEYGLVDPEFG